MKLYVSGPMTSVGPPTWNHPAFHKAAYELRCAGYRVVNPAELDDTTVPDWDKQEHNWYLRRDLKALVDCNGIVLLPNWERSKGARLELHVAQELDMRVFWTVAGALRQAAPTAVDA